MAWRWAAASVIGTSHTRSGDRLQDAYAVSRVGDDRIFAIVSDGAGSAEFGAYGAWIVCRYLTVRFRSWLRESSTSPDDDELANWIDDLRDRIAAIADRRESTRRQFAATLAAVLILPDEVLTLHVGDSTIVGRRGADWNVLCWPENGEYASSTYFVTDDPEPRLNITRQPRDHDAFALFSDGVGDLALSQLEQVAHRRFFDPMMRPVDSSPGEGRLAPSIYGTSHLETLARRTSHRPPDCRHVGSNIPCDLREKRVEFSALLTRSIGEAIGFAASEVGCARRQVKLADAAGNRSFLRAVKAAAGTALNALAEIYRAQGRTTKAEPLYKRSLMIYEKALDRDHYNVARTLNNLALLYLAQGRYAQAEPHGKALGPDDANVSNQKPNFPFCLCASPVD